MSRVSRLAVSSVRFPWLRGWVNAMIRVFWWLLAWCLPCRVGFHAKGSVPADLCAPCCPCAVFLFLFLFWWVFPGRLPRCGGCGGGFPRHCGSGSCPGWVVGLSMALWFGGSMARLFGCSVFGGSVFGVRCSVARLFGVQWLGGLVFGGSAAWCSVVRWLGGSAVRI